MDSPRLLQAEIHASFNTGSGDWAAYKAQITGLYSATGYAASGNATFGDFSDQFNGKIIELGMPTGLTIQPYDAGYRLTGINLS